jgi:outer membrane protein assembly factor BamB
MKIQKHPQKSGGFKSAWFFIGTLTVAFILFSVIRSCSEGFGKTVTFEPGPLYWSQFRGPNASGIAPENSDPPVHFNADTNLLWQTEILPGWSSPCIVEDKIFLTGFCDTDSVLCTMAIDRKNGEFLWKDTVSPVGYFDLHPISGYANPSVTSNGERVFSYFPSFGLIAHDLYGNRCWTYELEEVGETKWAAASSPVVVDSMVLMSVSDYFDPQLIAIDCESGEPRWSIKGGDHRLGFVMGRSTPVVWNNLVIMHHFQEITAYNPVSGEAEWWIPIPTSGIGTPVIRDSVLFVNTWTNYGERSQRYTQMSFEELVSQKDVNGNMKIERSEITDEFKIFQRPEIADLPETSANMNQERFFSQFDEDGDGALVESEWNALCESLDAAMQEHGMVAVSLNGHGKRSATDILWKVVEDTPETPSPLLIGQQVLFIKNGGIITVIEQHTGEVEHKERISAPGCYLASPMLAGNRVYTCSFNGTVTVLSADDFSVLAHNRLREKIGASPVAVDDVLYVRTEKHLFAFRET